MAINPNFIGMNDEGFLEAPIIKIKTLIFYRVYQKIKKMDMMDTKIDLIVPEENHLERIDKFLPSSLEIDLSRSYIQKLIGNGHIRVNDSAIKQNYKVKTMTALP